MDHESERSPRTALPSTKHSSPQEHHRTTSNTSSSERKSTPGSPSKGEELLKRTGSLRRKATKSSNLNGSVGRLSVSFTPEDEKKLEKDAALRDPVLFAVVQEEIEKRQFAAKFDLQEEEEDYKRELELLEQDEADLVAIADIVARSERVSSQMLETLDAFDARLARLASNLEPLTEYTTKMERVHSSIDAALREIERTLSHVELPMTMPALPPQNDLSGTLDRLDRIAEAQALVDSHRYYRCAEPVTKQLKALRLPLLHQLENDFASVLSRVCVPVDQIPEDINATLELVPEERVLLLRRICSHLADWNQSNFAATWVDRRGKFVLSSLRKLAPDAAEPLVRYERGSHRGVISARVLLQLLNYEASLLIQVMERVAPARRRQILAGLAESAVDLLLEKLEGASKLPNAPVLSAQVAGKLFPLLDFWYLVSCILPRYASLLNVEDNKQWKELSAALDKIAATCKRCVDAFEDEFRRGFKHAEIPSDGTVHELTANAMNFLKKLIEYRDAVDSLPGQKGSACVEFIHRVLQELNSQLDARKKDKKAVLATVFLLNNYHHILSSITSSPLLKSALRGDTIAAYEKLIEHNKAMYRQSWNKALEYLVDVNKNSAEASGKDTIKGKFKGFNTELESLFQAQRSYAIPDPDLRASLRTDVKSVLLPFYKRFLQQHESANFTENPSKYIKFTPETLESMLDRFFEDQVHQERRKTLAEKLLRF